MAVVFAIVGFLLSSQLVSVRANTARLETLQELYNQELDRIERLEKQVYQMGEDLERYRQAAAENTSQGEALRAELEKLGMTAGLVEVTGPGVTVILSNSAAVNTTGDEADYLIHDSDLLSVINELRSAGAEALSLNGERLLSTSAVRCTGAVVTVNGRQYAAPYFYLCAVVVFGTRMFQNFGEIRRELLTSRTKRDKIVQDVVNLEGLDTK